MFLQANSSLGLAKYKENQGNLLVMAHPVESVMRVRNCCFANLRLRPFIWRKVVPGKKVTLADENNVDPASRDLNIEIGPSYRKRQYAVSG